MGRDSRGAFGLCKSCENAVAARGFGKRRTWTGNGRPPLIVDLNIVVLYIVIPHIVIL
jgi:hypothetical protein